MLLLEYRLRIWKNFSIRSDEISVLNFLVGIFRTKTLKGDNYEIQSDICRLPFV